MRKSKDTVLISNVLETVTDNIQTNPYWSSVSTTVGDNTQLNYTIITDTKTNTYSVINYDSNETR